jgi:ferredoxin-NADP reductase
MSSSATSSVSTCKLVSRHEVAERTMAFHFEKPAGWTFKAGQFVDMTLLLLPRQMLKEIPLCQHQ